MNLESFHRTLVRILIVIWISGIAIVAVDLFVLDKERKAWNELKPLTSFAFQEDNSEIEDLRAQHNKYMTEGILPDRPDGKDSMPLPPALDSTETASTDILEDASGLTIEDILSEARQTELASQIEPAAGDISAVFLKDEFQDKDNQIAGSDKAHDVLSVIQDLEPYADTDTLEADDFFNTPSAKEIENAHNKQVPENEPEPASNDQKASDVIASIGETKEDVNPPTTKTNTTPQYTSPKGRGQVVIIIDDMGVSLRSKLVEVMDGPLTLAYLPYAKDLPARTKRAKSNGHELMVHMPMEAMNRNLDGGPRVLRTDTSKQEFQETVEWGLSQFDGYVGVNNHMGSRLTRDKVSMARLMSQLKGRGLYFIDSKTIGSSVAAKTAREYGLSYAIRDVFLDHEINKEFVRKALKKLEAIAYKKGHAIAIGHPHKETIEVLKEWIPTLKDKGLTLVPASAVIKHPVQQQDDDIAVNQTY